ncbi:hypothetical protein BHE74_00043124 [Ensete ventricosum]|nr:hypothetical protein BHE74_00043124 [Ensete ventricosum]
MEAPKRPLDLSYAAAAAGEPNPASPSPSSSSSSSASAPKRRQPPSARVPFRSPPPLKPSSVRIVFRILCPADKSGGVVGTGGAFLRRCREEIGARIRVEDPVPGSDERVVVVVAEAQPKRWAEPGGGEAEADVSPAQRALIRVFERILGEGVDGGGGTKEKETHGLVLCRLLAQGNQVGSVLGKGGKVVERIRQGSGAQVRVFGKDQVPTCASAGDELIHVSTCWFSMFFFYRIEEHTMRKKPCRKELFSGKSTLAAATKLFDAYWQVTGAFQSVHDALLLITNRIRDIIFPFRTYSSAGIGQSAHATYEMPFALPTSRHELTPSRANPPTSISDSADHAVGFHNTLDRQHPVSQSVDQLGVDRGSYGNDTTRPSSATDCAAPTLTPEVRLFGLCEVVNSGNTRRNQDAGKSLDFESGLIGRVLKLTPVSLLTFVLLLQISGAKVAVRDPKPGATEGYVTISGTIEQTRTAQSLLHAFILCGLEHN